MAASKVKSFTLSELLIVMIITAIVVGMGFSVLRLVQKQIHTIQRNFDTNAVLGLFEQRLCQDFNTSETIEFNKSRLLLLSFKDTVNYTFSDDCVLRDNDTIRLKLRVSKAFFAGAEVQSGIIDAISIAAEPEQPDYSIFVSKRNDVTFFMNQDGF